MSACMCGVFGRILWDDRFRQKFFADPVAACRVFEGPTAQASGLRALTRQDFQVLDQQLNRIRETLGAEVMQQIADDFGVQMMIGRAMLEPDFGGQLLRNSESISREFLGSGGSVRRAMAIFNSAGFKKLKGFTQAREALQKVGAGKRFSEGVAHGRVLNRVAGGRGGRQAAAKT